MLMKVNIVIICGIIAQVYEFLPSS